jgi:hypothetical protein
VVGPTRARDAVTQIGEHFFVDGDRERLDLDSASIGLTRTSTWWKAAAEAGMAGATREQQCALRNAD